MVQTTTSTDVTEVSESEKEQVIEGYQKPLNAVSDKFRPRIRNNPQAYAIKDEVVLVPDQGDKIYALNTSGTAIWRLCDGQHSLSRMLTELRKKFSGEDIQILSDITSALFQFQALDLLEPASLAKSDSPAEGTIVAAPSNADRPPVRIVHGIEDRPYFHWQLAIMFESLVGQMPVGWEINIVVCNNHRPITAELDHILQTYGVTYFTGESHADNHHIDFAGGGDRYVPMNRIEALNVISQQVAPDELVCLMDSDIFLYGELREDLFPRGNAMASNWIIGQEKYFQFSTNNTRGLSLPKLLEALGCEKEFKPGGVMIFLTGETLQANDKKVIRDCFRFLQINYLAAKILDLPSHGVWVAEMACFAMAMYPNDVDFELLEIEQFAVQEQHAKELEQGSFFHYYTDINDGSPGPFYKSEWHKQLFQQQSFLTADVESFLGVAEGDVEKRFLKLAIRSRDRLGKNV